MSWDYLVIGAGSAGCAVTHELVKSGRRVLLLEAGGSDRSPWIRFPAGQLRAIAGHDWGYRCQPDPSRNGRFESWLRGRVLGGSSSINGTLFARGAASDFDRWAHQSGQSEWSAKEVLRIYREMEDSDQPGPSRGHAGPLHLRTVRRPHALTRAFVEAARKTGFAITEDYNGDTQEGVAYAQFSQRRGFRCSAADAFLKPLRRAPNLKLVLDATVEKIEIQDGRASAVIFRHAGRPHREAAQEIIVCAGAIGSPHLLMLSGIGDPEELVRHGISPKVELPGVGKNLMEHPLLRLTYRTRIASYSLTEGFRQKVGIAARFLRSGEGPIANLFESVAFLKSSPSEQSPDIQLHFIALGYLALPNGSIELAQFPSVTVLINKSHPLSRGRIRLASANPADAPLIECRLLDQEADVMTLVRGIGVVRRIMQTNPIAALIEEEIAPGAATNSEAALQEYVRGHTTIAAHPAGTCRMGTDADAVVDPTLRVRGVENLWVADASIMPDLPSGNTNAACMMIGLKLGRYLNARKASGPDGALKRESRL